MGCGLVSSGSGVSESGGSGGGSIPRRIDPEPRGETIGGVIEPENALVEDFGPGWVKTGRWYVEGVTEVVSGCAEWDALAMIDDWGGTTTLWVSGVAELSMRVADLNFGAAAYVAEAARLPESCPELTLDGTVVSVTALDSFSDEITWFKLDAYPRFDQATIGLDPEMDTGREAWVAFAHRFNVVSRLVVSSGEGVNEDIVEALARRVIASLEGAPTEGAGPLSPPEGPPMFEAGVFPDVTFSADAGCRNAGRVEIDGTRWATNENAPTEWQGREIPGRLEVDGSEAVFVSADGFRISMTTGGVQASCSMWSVPDEADSPGLSQGFGRLSCETGTLIDERQPDIGQDPETIARSASLDVVRVEAGDPLLWWGYDAQDNVVVGVALGDIANADYQVFTCGQ